jgi:hypothetical protein
VVRKKNPARHANAQNVITSAPENGTLRNTRRSISGSVRRRSHATNASSAAMDTVNAERIGADRQPADGPSMMP